MRTNRRYRWWTPMMLGVLAGIFLLTATRGVWAQEKTNAAKSTAEKAQPQETKVKADVKKIQPANAVKDKKTPVQKETQMGPTRTVKPMPKSIKAQRGQAKTSSKRVKGIPQPTITLKPGEVPAIKFDTPVYDFGNIRSGPDVVHDYWFTNTGTGPLEILKVRPG